MKHLLMVGGIAAMLVAIAASQHSPPASDQALVIKAEVAAPVPDLASVATLDGYVIKDAAGVLILVPAASLSALEATPKTRSWRHSNVEAITPLSTKHNAATHTLTSKHVSNSAQRGWGFL